MSIISQCVELFNSLVSWLVAVIGHLGYTGVVGLMFLESSFFPFPSEVVVPPAGYLASQGEMNLILVILSGILGSILGGLFNYWIAVKWGRPIFEKYGKYFFITSETLDKADDFFEKHGHISTFTGRLIPVLRQYISLPAGLARMPLKQFCAYTGIRNLGRNFGTCRIFPRQQRLIDTSRSQKNYLLSYNGMRYTYSAIYLYE